MDPMGYSSIVWGIRHRHAVYIYITVYIVFKYTLSPAKYTLSPALNTVFHSGTREG